MKKTWAALAIVIGITVIFALFIGYFFLLQQFFPDEISRGLFGDSFGAVNAFFTGVALIGVVITLALNLRQLKATERTLLADHERRTKEVTLQALTFIRPKMKRYSRFLNEHVGPRKGISDAFLQDVLSKPELATELQDFLEDIETFAMAVNVGVYDEDLTIQASGPLISVLWMRSKLYIDHYRINYPSVADDFEELARKSEGLKSKAYRAQKMVHKPKSSEQGGAPNA